jgi:hypothetical protein
MRSALRPNSALLGGDACRADGASDSRRSSRLLEPATRNTLDEYVRQGNRKAIEILLA